jgi:hypothetical protein
MTNTRIDHRATPLPPGAKALDFELPSTPDRTGSLAVSAQDTHLEGAP